MQTICSDTSSRPASTSGPVAAIPASPRAPTNEDIEAVIKMATSTRPTADGRPPPGKDTRTQLFVGNLPYRVRWQDLKDLFRKSGTVLRADVALGPDNRSRGYGTVLLASAEDAGRAVDMFNGFVWQTRTLEVRLDRIPPELDLIGGAASNPVNAVSAVGATGMGGKPGQGHAHVPPFHLGGLNSSVGAGGFHIPSPSSTLPYFAAQQQQYSHFPTANVGPPNLESTDLPAFHGVGLDRPRSTSNNVGNGMGKTLYVGNLPFQCQWQELKDLFRQAGTILRADVSVGHDGRSRGFGTVTYATDADAERAVKMFNGFDFCGRNLKVHFDKFIQSYSPSPLTAFANLALPSSAPNTAHPSNQNSNGFGASLPGSQLYWTQALPGFAEQKQNLGMDLLSTQTPPRAPPSEGAENVGATHLLAQFPVTQTVQSTSPVRPMHHAGAMEANNAGFLGTGSKSVLQDSVRDLGRLSSLLAAPGDTGLGSISQSNLSTIANASSSPQEVQMSPTRPSLSLTLKSTVSAPPPTVNSSSTPKRPTPVGTRSMTPSIPNTAAPSVASNNSTSPMNVRAQPRIARITTSPRTTSLSSHPAHPGQIQIPPPLPSFPMIPPHGFSPGTVVSPGAHPYSPHSHYPPQITPMQHHSGNPIMTPHGIGIPPITPSMPSFQFVPGMQPSPGGSYTPGFATPAIGHDYPHNRSMSMPMVGYGGMVGMMMANATPPVPPTHTHAHQAMMSAMSPGVAMSPGSHWSRSLAGPVGSGIGGDGNSNAEAGPKDRVHNEGTNGAGSRRGSEGGMIAVSSGYFAGVPIPMERPSSAHVEQDGGYFVGITPLSSSVSSHDHLENDVLRDAGPLGRRGSGGIEASENVVDESESTRHRSSSGSVRSVSETFDRDHEGIGPGDRRNSSSVATSWRSEDSDTMEKTRAEFGMDSSSVFPIMGPPKRRARSKEPRKPPLFGSSSSGSGDALPSTRSGYGVCSGLSKSAGASAGTSIDGDVLSGDECSSANRSRLQLQGSTSRALSMSAAETIVGSGNSKSIAHHPGLVQKSHSDETGDKIHAVSGGGVEIRDRSMDYSFPRTPGNWSLNGKKAQRDSGAPIPDSEIGKGVGLGFASGS